jgi:hypothetical protein
MAAQQSLRYGRARSSSPPLVASAFSQRSLLSNDRIPVGNIRNRKHIAFRRTPPVHIYVFMRFKVTFLIHQDQELPEDSHVRISYITATSNAFEQCSVQAYRVLRRYTALPSHSSSFSAQLTFGTHCPHLNISLSTLQGKLRRFFCFFWLTWKIASRIKQYSVKLTQISENDTPQASMRSWILSTKLDACVQGLLSRRDHRCSKVAEV